MQRFIYKAKSKDGKSREGKIESRDTTTAVGILRERGLVVIDIKAVSENGGLPGALATFGGVKLDDTVAFTRQMATMMSSGLPLTEALSVLELQSKPAMAKVIGDVLRDVQAGNTVADALAKHENVFSGVYVSLIRAGEAAGALDDVLKRLARNLEKEKDFKAKTKGALIYPAIVIVAMFGVTIIMMVGRGTILLIIAV